jgi:mono/diheme cytochrome c family protein
MPLPRSHVCACVLCAVLGLAAAALLAAPTAARGQAPAAGKPVSFINDIAPIFKESCFACHDAKKRSGKLDMTSYEKLRAGGSNDDPITAGKPDESDLVEVITSDGSNRMPPKDKGEPLTKEQVALVKRWIQEGAKLDAGVTPKADLVKELRVRWTPPPPPAAYKYPAIVNSLAFTPDNKQFVVGGHHELTVWNLADGKLLKRIPTRAERAYAMAFLPSGQLVVAGGRPGQEGDVRVFDLNAPPVKTENGVAILDGVKDPKVMLKQLVDTDDSVLCLALSADGKKLAAGGCDRIVRVWDVSGGPTAAKLEQTIENHADWVLGVALAPDGKHLLTSSRDKTAKVWDLAAKESVLTFPDHQNTVYAVAPSKDSKLGYSVGADRQLRTFNAVGEGKQVRAAGGHGDEVYKVVANPAGTVLVTCSADKTVRSWDPASGAAGKTFSGMTDHVYAVALSGDAALVAAGSYNGEVKVWNMADAKVVKEFNASPGYVAPVAAKK